MNDTSPKRCPFCFKPAEMVQQGCYGCSDRECPAYLANIVLRLWNRRPNPETQAVAPNVQEVQHNDELMGKIFNITRSADSLDSSWLGKVRAAINEYIKGSAK